MQDCHVAVALAVNGGSSFGSAWPAPSSAPGSAMRIAPADQAPLLGMAQGVLSSLLIATPIVLVQAKGDRVALRRLAAPAAGRLLRRQGRVLFHGDRRRPDAGARICSRGTASPSTSNSDAPWSLPLPCRWSATSFFDMGSLLGFGTLTNMLHRPLRPAAPRAARLPADRHEGLDRPGRTAGTAAFPRAAERLLSRYLRRRSRMRRRDPQVCRRRSHPDLERRQGARATATALPAPSSRRISSRPIGSAISRRYGAVPTFRAAVHYRRDRHRRDRRRAARDRLCRRHAERRRPPARRRQGSSATTCWSSTDLLEHAALPPDLKAEKLPTLTVRGRAGPARHRGAGARLTPHAREDAA